MSRPLPHDALLPRPPGGMAPGAALAVLAHLGLLFALTAAVDWRLRKPEVVASAELWSAVPQAAAPRAAEPPAPTSARPPAPEPQAPPPPPPPPPPAPAPAPVPAPPPVARPEPQRDAEIALERQRKEQQKAEQLKAEQLKAEREKAERLKADQLKADREKAQREKDAEALARKKREAAEAEAKRIADAEAAKKKREAEAAKAEEQRLAQQREENLRRILGQAGAPSGTGGPQATGTAATDAGPSASYAGRLVALVRPNIVFTGSAEANAAAEVEVRAGPSGSIISRRLVKPSGQPDWDEAVLRAIDKTARLPRDTDGRVPPVIVMVFKPRE